jgi:hypothetical protein
MSRTKKQIAANQVRRLRTMRKQMLEMSAQWEDVDQYSLNRLEELADLTEETAIALMDADDGAKP